MMIEETLASFRDALLDLDAATCERLAEDVAARRGSPAAMDELVVPALERMGEDWAEGRISLAQIYMAGRICEEIVEKHFPIREGNTKPLVAVANLLDHHALGKRLVLAALRSAGIGALDLGSGLSPAEIVEKVRDSGIRVLLVSTLMLAAALAIRDLRTRLDAAGCDVRLVAGGAPFRFDAELANEVGADAFGRTAFDAARIVSDFLRKEEAA